MKSLNKGVIFAMVGGTCWGLSGVMGKYLFDTSGLNAVWLVNIRLLFGGAIMIAMSAVRRGGKIFDVWKKKETALSQLFFCLFGMTACQLSYFVSIEYSNPATGTVLQYMSPAIIMIFAVVIEKRRPRPVELGVLIAVIVGVFLLATHGNVHTLAISEKALFWGIISAFTAVVYNVQPRKLLQEFGSMETVGWAMLVGGFLVTPFIKVWEVPGTWSAQTFVMLAAVVIVGTVMSFGFYLQGVLMLGPVRASMFCCMEPLTATIMTAVVLKEIFVTMDIVGMICIVGGVTALAIFDKEEEESHDEEGIGIGDYQAIGK